MNIDIQNKAFSIFRDWKKNVMLENPSVKILINDESTLTENLLDSISNAKKTLASKQKKHTVSDSIGYIQGFMFSNLNEKWIFEYITKQTTNYKEFVALTALKIFLNHNEIVSIQIENIFQQLYQKNNNLLESNFDIQPNQLDIPELDEETTNFKQNAVLQMIENKVNNYIKINFDKNEQDYMNPMENYFTNDEILYLLNNDL